MTQATATCCYCGCETTAQGQVVHQRRCLHGPMGERVKTFCRAYIARHGRISARKWQLNKERRALGLPSDHHITQVLGSWPAFIEWCGLEYKRIDRSGKERSLTGETANFKRIDVMLAEGRNALETAYDFRAIPAIDRGVKPVYNWRTKRHEDMHVLELR